MRHAPITPNTRFGALTALARYHSDTDPSYPVWFCRCDCGQAIVTRTSYLQAGRVKSCPDCRHAAYTLHLVHGMTDGWHGMRTPILLGYAWLENAQGKYIGVTPISHAGALDSLLLQCIGEANALGYLAMPMPVRHTFPAWRRALRQYGVGVIYHGGHTEQDVTLAHRHMHERALKTLTQNEQRVMPG